MITAGSFREDLFYRLAEIVIRIPSLAERHGDPVLLAKVFLKRFAAEMNPSVTGFAADALAAIDAHEWPGNVRELENRVKRAVIMADGKLVNADDLDLGAGEDEDADVLNLKAAREAADRRVIRHALSRSRAISPARPSCSGSVARRCMTCSSNMTFRRDTAAGLTALVLALAGCSEEGGTGMSARDEGRKPALVQLLGDADRAMAAGQLADAGRKLDEARGLDPNDPALWVAIARLRFRGGEHLTAIEAADRALQLGPDHPPALLMRAVLVRDAHGFAAALPWFEAALAADPYYRDGWAEYAATLGDAGEAGAMLEAVRKLAEVAPGDERVPYLQAVLAARGGEYSLARSLLARSGMAARGVPAALQLDAVISLAEGNADSAAVILEGLVARQPSHAKLRELLAKAMLESGRGTN